MSRIIYTFKKKIKKLPARKHGGEKNKNIVSYYYIIIRYSYRYKNETYHLHGDYEYITALCSNSTYTNAHRNILYGFFFFFSYTTITRIRIKLDFRFPPHDVSAKRKRYNKSPFTVFLFFFVFVLLVTGGYGKGEKKKVKMFIIRHCCWPALGKGHLNRLVIRSVKARLAVHHDPPGPITTTTTRPSMPQSVS